MVQNNQSVNGWLRSLVPQRLSLSEFVKQYLSMFRPMPDIVFIDYLLDRLDAHDPRAFEVPHTMLRTFNVAVGEYDIEEYFGDLGLIIDEDWTMPSDKFMLTVSAFKQCLIHAPNTMKYSKFYKYCDEAMAYYIKYMDRQINAHEQNIKQTTEQLALATRVISVQNALLENRQ